MLSHRGQQVLLTVAKEVLCRLPENLEVDVEVSVEGTLHLNIRSVTTVVATIKPNEFVSTPVDYFIRNTVKEIVHTVAEALEVKDAE